MAAAILREADRIARLAGAGAIALHAQTYALDLYTREGYRERGAEFVEEGIEHVAMEKRLLSPELRIDPLSGLKVIVAGERGSRPGAFLDSRRVRRSTARRPVRGRPRGPHAARGLRAARATARLAGAVVPNLYPALSAGERAAGGIRSPPGAASPTCSARGPRSARTR